MRETLKNLVAGLTGTGGLLRVRALLALGITGAVLAMYLQEISIPGELLVAWTGVTGVYFGSRIANGGS